MPTLSQLLPDVDVLLSLEPEELAPALLSVAKSQLQNGMFSPGNLSMVTVGTGLIATQASPYAHREREVELASRRAGTG